MGVHSESEAFDIWRNGEKRKRVISETGALLRMGKHEADTHCRASRAEREIIS